MRPALSLLFIVVSLQCAQAQELHPYREARFGTSAQVPADWRPESIHDQSGASGHYFFSPDGSSWSAVFGLPVSADVSVHVAAPEEHVTYSAGGRGWSVRSGFKGDRIFYRKALLSCGGRVAHLLAFEYPAEQKREHDRLVTVMSRSLRGDRSSC
jgi:hypothetical protein